MRSQVRGLLGLAAAVVAVNAATVKETVTSSGGTTYNHNSCWTKGSSSTFDALSDDAFASNTMTVEKCADYCTDYKYFGVSNGKECYCGDSLAGSALQATSCTVACKGDTTELCGGLTSLNVYARQQPLDIVPSSGEFQYQTCWTDGGSGNHALTDTGFSSTKMTVPKCAAFCDGYTYFGVSGGNKCYCGDTINSATQEAANQADCNTPCSGAGTTACGGSGNVNLYKIPIASLPSSTTAVATSTITPAPTVSGTASATVTSTAPTSSALPDDDDDCEDDEDDEDDDDCEDDEDESSTTVPTATPTATATPSSVAPTTTSTSTSTTVTPTVTPTATPNPFPDVLTYSWTGCYEEIPGRLFRAKDFAADTMTLEACAAFCASFPYFGVEYSRECYCGTDPVAAGGVLAASVSECNMPCAGNSTELCGAGNRLSVYHDPAKNGPSTGGSGLGSTKKGCYTETTAGRTLAAKGFGDDHMTLQLCSTSCAGYKYWGVEYGRECFCGNDIQPLAEVKPDSECNMLCSGDDSELCGAGNRVMIYERNT